MKQVFLTDTTLKGAGKRLSFKEKIEIVRLLDTLSLDALVLMPIEDEKIDPILIKTIADAVKNTKLIGTAGLDKDSADLLLKTLQATENKAVIINVGTSPAQMEYLFHLKPQALADKLCEQVKYIKQSVSDVRVVLEDATRSDEYFIDPLVAALIEAGATEIAFQDAQGILLPEEFNAFIEKRVEKTPALKNINIGAVVSDMMSFGVTSLINAASNLVNTVYTAIAADRPVVSCSKLVSAVETVGERKGISVSADSTKINAVSAQVERYFKGETQSYETAFVNADTKEIDSSATIDDIERAIRELGYLLSEDDISKVYTAFKAASGKKNISMKELDKIIANEAMQVPPTYTLNRFRVTTSNVMDCSAVVVLEKDGKSLSGVSLGDGSIDAAFIAIEQILGYHYELDDFSIRSITEGRSAMGEAFVRLRSGGKVYSGSGLSTDIIAASIGAYLNALNKIEYEENK